MSVNITQSAKQQIGKICCENSNRLVRLAILSGGCNGYTKNWDITDTIEEDDTVFSVENGTLLIDSISLEFLKDSTIDYKHDLLGSYFTVDIPAATSACGCGTSFSI